MATALLGTKLVSSAGEVETAAALDVDCIGIYFSAHWCPPCRGFTPVLAEIYTKLKAAGKRFEVVFVSSDQGQSGFDGYFSSMPWLALPYGERGIKADLSSRYGVSGIPTLVLLNSQMEVITTNGRGTVTNDPSGGWIPASLHRSNSGNRTVQIFAEPVKNELEPPPPPPPPPPQTESSDDSYDSSDSYSSEYESSDEDDWIDQDIQRVEAGVGGQVQLPDVHSSTASDAVQSWATVQLGTASHLSVAWQDQGWGNQKGHLFARSPAGEWIRLTDQVAPHGKTNLRVQLPAGLGPGAVEFGYLVGGGGGHQLHVTSGSVQTSVPSKKPEMVTKEVEVGPLWNNGHAQEVGKAYGKANPTHRWTGSWWTTVECEMSVLQVKMPAGSTPNLSFL